MNSSRRETISTFIFAWLVVIAGFGVIGLAAYTLPPGAAILSAFPVSAAIIWASLAFADREAESSRAQKRRTELWEQEHPDPARTSWTYAGYLRQQETVRDALEAAYGQRCRDCGVEGGDLDPSWRCFYCAELAALGDRDPDLPNPMLPKERR